MEPDSRQPDAARLQLLDVRLHADGPTVRFGGRLAAVLTQPSARAGVSHLIASAVAGPCPEGVDGSVVAAGEIVSVRSLPEPQLPPAAPILVDRPLVDAEWAAWCAARRDELAIEHASRRLERHRISAALERSGREAEATEPEALVDEVDPLRVRLADLLDPADREAPPPLPEGTLLADAWDAHAALVRARGAADITAAAALEPLERRVDRAREIVAAMPRPVPLEVQEQIERCHNGVLDAEAELLAVKRRKRAKAVERYEQAVAAELVALADAGMESYAAFLVAVAAGEAAEAGEREIAEAELAAARAELDEARLVRDVPTGRELDERAELMRDRASELLGRPAGADAATELRALRIEPERTVDEIEEIAAVLREAGVDDSDNVVASARAFLAVPRPAPESRMETASASAITPDEVAALEAQRFEHDRALADLTAELERLDDVAVVPVERLPANELAAALDRVLDRYRAGALLGGRLPIVVDGVIDEIGRDAREAAVRTLAGADDVQVIVVSDDAEVLQSLANAGSALVRWPERPQPERPQPERPQPQRQDS
jgi:hypothetical protein